MATDIRQENCLIIDGLTDKGVVYNYYTPAKSSSDLGDAVRRAKFQAKDDFDLLLSLNHWA